MPRLLVIGGNGAGMSAASKAKRRNPDLEVEVLEAGPHISYSICGVPELASGVVQDPDQLVVLTPKDAEERGIHVRLGTTALGLNPYTKEVAVKTPQGRDALRYDKLVIATGCEPRRDVPGAHLAGVHAIRRLEDGIRLMADLKATKAKRVAVLGGGPVGLEMAVALRSRGLKVTLLQRGDRLLPAFDRDLTDGLAPWLGQLGIDVRLDTPVTGLVEGTAGRVGHVAAREDVACDAAILALGVKPATDFLLKSGITTTKEGYVLVDDAMRTNVHDVWAAGDCVATRHVVTGRPTPAPLALPANRMGRVAGDAVAASLEKVPGRSAYFPGVLGTFVTRLAGLAFAKTGLSEEEAKAEGIDCVAALVEGKAKAGYMPGADEMAVKLVAEQGSGKLLGAQIAGPEDAVLRIDAAAVALHAGMKVAKLAELETAYTPALSPVWDPLIVAAGECAKLVRR